METPMEYSMDTGTAIDHVKDQTSTKDMAEQQLVVRDHGRRGARGERALSAQEFHRLADVPAVAVWLANSDNPNTQRAYRSDVEAFIAFCGIERPDEFRDVTRAHIIAWRSTLETNGNRVLAPATIRRKLSAVSS